MLTHITPDIRYIGVDDPDMHLFESQYATPEGMCYNSYLIADEQVAIMDTTDARTVDAWLARLNDALAGRRPDYLIVHHMEPDHSSGIVAALKAYPELRIVCSAKAAQMMPLYLDASLVEGRTLVVKEGDTLPLGRHTLSFIAAPMVHWPEVIMSYDTADGLLFSADGFGKFGVYDADPDDWACEARRYYFNICGKYGSPVSTVLRKASALPALNGILPLHGPVLQGEAMAEALRLYSIWSSYGVETEGICIAYASIHGHTAEAADVLADMLRQRGCPKVAVTDLCRDDQAEAVEDAFRYPTLVCMASSYDAGVFTPMHDFLHRLSVKAYQRRRVALVENGSWAPSAAKTMRSLFEGMKDITLVEPVVTLRGRLTPDSRSQLEVLAEALVKAE